MGSITRRLAALEKHYKPKAAFKPRHIQLVAWDDPRLPELRAEDAASSDGGIGIIVLVGIKPVPSRFNDAGLM